MLTRGPSTVVDDSVQIKSVDGEYQYLKNGVHYFSFESRCTSPYDFEPAVKVRLADIDSDPIFLTESGKEIPYQVRGSDYMLENGQSFTFQRNRDGTRDFGYSYRSGVGSPRNRQKSKYARKRNKRR